VIPDAATVSAYLEESHAALATRVGQWAETEIRSMSEPNDDAGARVRARELAELLGRDRWLAPAVEVLDLRACCLIREALAAASPLADAVFALQALGTMPLTLGAEKPLRDLWLPRVARGEAIAAFAMTEPEAGSDVASLQTTALRAGDEYVIDGQKTLISNAGIADFYCVFAVTKPGAGSRGISCFLVEADRPGLFFLGPQVMSAPHPLGELRFEGCRVPASNRIGDEGRGFAVGMAALDRLRPTVAAAACGMAARALDEARAHASRRRQFGKPLAGFQLIQEKLARSWIDLTAARLLTYRAAAAADAGAERITVEAAMAKAFATEAAQRIIDDAIQVLGGRGVLADSPVERLYRAVRALRIYEGTTEVQHLIIAKHLMGGAGE
jgi:acyl-CoA dehydrogenase